MFFNKDKDKKIQELEEKLSSEKRSWYRLSDDKDALNKKFNSLQKDYRALEIEHDAKKETLNSVTASLGATLQELEVEKARSQNAIRFKFKVGDHVTVTKFDMNKKARVIELIYDGAIRYACDVQSGESWVPLCFSEDEIALEVDNG